MRIISYFPNFFRNLINHMGEENSSNNKDARHLELPTLNWFMSRLEGVRGMWERQEQRVGAAAVLVFTCACIALMCKNKHGRKRRGKHAYNRSLSMGALHGGKIAMQRILDSQHARVDESELMNAEDRFKELLAKGLPDFKELQSVAAKLEMSGKEDNAVKMLNKAWKKARDANQHHEAHELEMLLVEMLIYQGKYKDALDRQCLKDEEISDARRHLYKALVYVMLGYSNEAEASFRAFNELRTQMRGPFDHADDIPYEEAHDFGKFEKTVKLLKQEIGHARAGTR